MWMNYKYPELMVFPIKPRSKFHQCLSSIDNICNEMECSEAFSSYIYICIMRYLMAITCFENLSLSV